MESSERIHQRGSPNESKSNGLLIFEIKVFWLQQQKRGAYSLLRAQSDLTAPTAKRWQESRTFSLLVIECFLSGGHIDNSPTSVIYPGDCPPNSGRSNPIRTTTSVHAAKSAVMEKQPLVYPNDGLTFRSIRDRLASLDLYPKTLEDFRIKTLGGATGLFGFTLSSFGLYSNYRFSFSLSLQ